MIWDRETLAAPRRAIVWQDRRTARLCDRLREAGHEDRIRELTGLRLDPYFTATKVTWLAEHDHATWQGIADGSLAVGTVDSYLIARLTGGRRHVTDASNASRTMLFDIGAGTGRRNSVSCCKSRSAGCRRWCPPRGSPGTPTRRRSSAWPCRSPGIAGDQQAALFGQACFTPGDTKCTYGTGSFVLANTGPDRQVGRRAAVHGGVDGLLRGPDVRAGGLGVRDRGGGAVAA